MSHHAVPRFKALYLVLLLVGFVHFPLQAKADTAKTLTELHTQGDTRCLISDDAYCNYPYSRRGKFEVLIKPVAWERPSWLISCEEKEIKGLGVTYTCAGWVVDWARSYNAKTQEFWWGSLGTRGGVCNESIKRYKNEEYK